MLEKIRQISHSKFFKFFFFLLALAFALSLGDLGKSSSNVVANVGAQKISLQDFLKARSEIQLDIPYPEARTKQANILALQNLITRALLEQEAKNLGLKVSPETLAEYIRNDKNFHKDGTFDLEIYKKLLAQNNLSEADLLKSLSNQVAVKFLVNSITANLPLKKILTDYYYQFAVEKRAISLVSAQVKPQIFSSIAENELKDYYQKNQNLFQTKEKRSYSYMTISLAELKKNSIITEEEIKKEYQANTHEYSLPETRDFFHFLAPSEKIAKEVIKTLETNNDHKQVAKNFIEQKVISENLNNQPSNSFFVNIEANLFKLKEHQVSQIAKSDLGWHIFKVVKIHPKLYEPLAQAKARIEESLKTKAAELQLYEISKQIEDDLASGADFEEIAKRYNLNLNKVEDASGNDQITLIAFQTNLHEESVLTQIGNNQEYVIVKVNNIAPAKTQNFSEALDKVKILYTMQLREKIAQESAELLKQQKIADPIQAMNILKPILSKYSLKDQDIEVDVLREEISRPIISKSNLPNDLVTQIFKLKIGDCTLVVNLDAAKAGFAIVDKLMPMEQKDSQLYAAIEQTVTKQYNDDFYDQYINYLYSKYKPEINQALIDKATKETP